MQLVSALPLPFLCHLIARKQQWSNSYSVNHSSSHNNANKIKEFGYFLLKSQWSVSHNSPEKPNVLLVTDCSPQWLNRQSHFSKIISHHLLLWPLCSKNISHLSFLSVRDKCTQPSLWLVISELNSQLQWHLFKSAQMKRTKEESHQSL